MLSPQNLPSLHGLVHEQYANLSLCLIFSAQEKVLTYHFVELLGGTMGWFDSLKNWGKDVWEHPSASHVARFSYNTLIHFCEQVAALPKALYSAVMHPPTRTVASHLLRIAAEDVVPMALATYANNLAQHHGQAYLDARKEQDWWSIDTVLITGLYALHTAAWIYTTRKEMQFLVRTAVVTIEAPTLLNAARQTPPMTVCVDEQCSSLRYIQGTGRDTVAYVATQAALYLLNYIPVVGAPLATSLTVYHRGRYVLTVVLPEVCNRHQMEYLREYPELALSLGLSHWGASWIANTYIQSFTGIPTPLYAPAVIQMLLVAQISLAAHLHLPAPVKKSSRSALDPLTLYQDFIGFLFDVMSLGLKIKIPRMMKAQQSNNMKEFLMNLPWSDWSGKGNRLWHHPLLTHTLVPRLLHSRNAFLLDPIIEANWKNLQKTLIGTLKEIEKIADKRSVKFAGAAPNGTANAIWLMFGLPKFITKLLLQLITNEHAMQKLAAWRRDIEGIHVDIVIPLVVDPTAIALNKPAPRVDDDPKQPTTKLLQLTTSSLSARDVIQQKPKGALPGKPAASTVIHKFREPNRNSFFKTTQNRMIPTRATVEDIEDHPDWVEVDAPSPPSDRPQIPMPLGPR